MKQDLNIHVPLSVDMAIKSLTITEEAYKALKQLKHGKESFSQVILRVSRDKVGATAKFLGCLKMSEKEYQDMKKRIRERRMEIEREARQRNKNIQRKMA
jgi:predicted CopG family antitoxin